MAWASSSPSKRSKPYSRWRVRERVGRSSATPPSSIEHGHQRPTDAFAQGESGPGGIPPQPVHENAREFDGKGNFRSADRNRPLQLLRSLEVPIGLTLGDGTRLCELLDGKSEVASLARAIRHMNTTIYDICQVG